ncbi:MAG TPA: ABC transporter permease, partial [Pseudomonadales bacterium]|nr:ABC transporter permease [Pseudomonadales bacterium]
MRIYPRIFATLPSPKKQDKTLMQGNSLEALWRNRGFIAESVKRDFHVRYRNSVLGSTWALLNPLALIVVYTVIFSNVMHTKLPTVTDHFGYSIYLCSGVFAWTLFTETVLRCQTVFIENANLLKKLAFPRLSLPIIVCLNALIGFTILSMLFVVFLLVTGSFPGWPTLFALPLLMLQIIFSLALGVGLGILNVFFRDVGHGFNIIMQFWFWLTP